MRFITWNMGGGAFRRYADEAWRYLFDQLAPDVALVQEVPAAVPTFISELGRSFHETASERARWGSAVIVRSGGGNPFTIRESNCYLCGAEIEVPFGTVVVISTHVSPSGNQQRTLRAFVETLAATLTGRSFIVAGDFNAARHWDAVYGRNDYTWFFDEMKARGFHECHWAQHGREVQTFWGSKTREPYQDDHFFVSPDLVARVRSCDVIDNANVRRLSDHGPVLLDVDL